MFTTVASGGWGAPPPRPLCVKALHQTGFLGESPNFQSSCCACPTKQPQYDRTRAGTGPSQILGGFARVARAEGARENFSKPEKPENGARKKVYLIPCTTLKKGKVEKEAIEIEAQEEGRSDRQRYSVWCDHGTPRN